VHELAITQSVLQLALEHAGRAGARRITRINLVIGELAVNGTVNDLAMRGARPLYLSAGFILEEGLPMDARA
jgi:hydrogenase maturation factor